MGSDAVKQTQSPPPPTQKRLWFDAKYWLYILPTVYLAYVVYHMLQLSGIFNEVKEHNIDDCVKMEGPSEFKNCEDFVLSEGGIAYVGCDPIRIKYNDVMGINRLAAGEKVPSGGIWKVNYNEMPGSIDKFEINGAPSDFHPLGINVDIHPVSGKKTFITINKAHSDAPSVELFDVNDEAVTLEHKRTIRHPEIYSPNSIHPIQDVRFRGEDDMPSFFFSNDHYFSNRVLKTLESIFLQLGNVKFYNARTGQVEDGVHGLFFANGVTGTDEILFVSETYNRAVKQYKIVVTEKSGIPHVHLDHVNEAKFNMAVDNLRYLPKQELVIVAGHPKPLEFLKYIIAENHEGLMKPPSQVDVWDLKTGETRVLMQDNGSLFGSSTTGAFDVENSKLVVSGIYEGGLLVCDF